MPSEIILSVNSGSSSVKVTAYTIQSLPEKPKSVASVQIKNLTSPPTTLKAQHGSDKPVEEEIGGIESQEDAFHCILDHLLGERGPEDLNKKEDIRYVAHRIVHGGDSESPRSINDDTLEYLEELSDLAPLHNSTALEIVKAVAKQLPHAENLVFFDTSFHSTIPKHIQTYPIDPKIASHNKLRRYGFHGISYRFIVNAVASHLQKPPADLNIIALHLGSGASACCIKNGSSFDTTMGLTPLSGLPGATRSGNVDPSLVFHYTHEAGKMSSLSTSHLHITSAEEILNKKSGWKALTGTTDFGKVVSLADQGDQAARLAFDIFVDRIVSFIGSYYVKLNGEVDALVFAGGIGENSFTLRDAVVGMVECLGFSLDQGKNSTSRDATVTEISSNMSKHRIIVCQTDEQVQMAADVVKWEGRE